MLGERGEVIRRDSAHDEKLGGLECLATNGGQAVTELGRLAGARHAEGHVHAHPSLDAGCASALAAALPSCPSCQAVSPRYVAT